MAREGENTLPEYRERRCRGHVWWKTVPKAGAGNRKSPFADGREVERRCCKLVGGSRPECLPGWHVSGKVKYDDRDSCAGALAFTALSVVTGEHRF